MTDEVRWEGDLRSAPSWIRQSISAAGVMEAPDDPQETITVALTDRGLLLFSFGLYLVQMLHPELADAAAQQAIKLSELADAQEFLPADDDAE